jgi:threonine dehydratase
MITYSWFVEAQNRIKPFIRNTPVSFDKGLDVLYKWENHQITGSFKARGALNKVLSLTEAERKNGLVAASAGNHGQGVALAGAITGSKATIFLPKNASTVKIQAIREKEAAIQFVAGGYELAETTAQEYARKNSMEWISPYNDGQVISGQATIALELMEQVDLADYQSIIIPVGGGGLAAGMGLVLSEKHPHIKVIGVQSYASAFFHNLFYYQTQEGVVESSSVADGLEGRVEDNAITIPILQRVLDDIILVTEEEIEEAIRWVWTKNHEIIEGSAAVTLAARLNGKIKPLPSLLILSGGNIDQDVHNRITAD